MHPADMLADVGMVVDIRIHTGPNQGVAKGGFVKAGRAGGHDDPVDRAIFQILHDHFLAGVGTHEHVGSGRRYSGQIRHLLAHRFHIHMIGYVAATIADVDADFSLFVVLFLFYLFFGHSCISPSRVLRVPSCVLKVGGFDPKCVTRSPPHVFFTPLPSGFAERAPYIWPPPWQLHRTR